MGWLGYEAWRGPQSPLVIVPKRKFLPLYYLLFYAATMVRIGSAEATERSGWWEARKARKQAKQAMEEPCGAFCICQSEGGLHSGVSKRQE